MQETCLEIKCWAEEEFLSQKEEWKELLTNSNADKLFLSWTWMYNWWQMWGQHYSSSLLILAAYQDGKLVGIAPLYSVKDHLFKNSLASIRIEFIGSKYRSGSGIRSEYQQFILHNQYKKEAADALFKYLFNDKAWDELILSDLIVGSDTRNAYLKYAAENKCYIRIERIENSYTIDTSGTFKDYIAKLGKNTRLKLYNRRKQLEKHGHITTKKTPIKSFDQLTNTLNDFHKDRWSATCFNDNQKSFLLMLFDEFTNNGMTACNELKVNGKTLSAMVNIVAGERIYNIQLGFAEGIDKKISMGTLHLGYVIEETFSNPAILEFDLLAGNGKNTNYKARISKSYCELETSQCIRNNFFKLVFLAYDKIKAATKRL